MPKDESMSNVAMNSRSKTPGFSGELADWKSAIQQIGNLRYDAEIPHTKKLHSPSLDGHRNPERE